MAYPDLFASARTRRLDNGLTVCLLPDSRVPLVSTALYYRVGTRNEEQGQGGIAHFLEHMMFKGSASYPAGAVDRRTQVLGGSNNAFTSHDATVYHFAFAADRWQEAIAIEADRMAGLLLESDEVESERRVILEEISMVEDDPWAHLEERVAAELFDSHAYGQPVLGTRETVGAISSDDLASFHHRFYGPSNAVLVVVGDLRPDECFAAIERAFDELPPRRPSRERAPETGVGHRSKPSRFEIDRGDVPRLFAAMPAPALGSREHPALRVALAILATGRSSRMQGQLVEEGRLASWMSLDLSDTEEDGFVSLVLETAPGRVPGVVEEAALEALDGFSERPPEAAELERAKAVLRAEWILSHERLHQRALTLGSALAFHDRDFPGRYREALDRVEIVEVMEASRVWLDPDGVRVVGWSGKKGWVAS